MLTQFPAERRVIVFRVDRMEHLCKSDVVQVIVVSPPHAAHESTALGSRQHQSIQLHMQAINNNTLWRKSIVNYVDD